MVDPYELLGISRDATDEEIKKAYRLMSRKYHPDANIDNPNKAAAETKFKEIQQAYQQIMKEKAGGGTQGSYGQSGPYSTGSPYQSYGSQQGGYGGQQGQQGGYGGFGFEDFFGFGYGGRGYQSQGKVEPDPGESSHLRAAANYINNSYYQEALNVLSSVTDRDARWYYYSAIANSGAGNNVIAKEHAQRAAQMAPERQEYQQLVTTLASGGTWYQNNQAQYGGAGMADMSGTCMKVCWASVFCNMCIGGRMCC